MATYILLGKYTPEGIDGISSERTDKAIEYLGKYDGKIKSMYVTLGQHDLVIIAEFPGIQQAMKASLAVTRLTGITFSTSEGVTVSEFDKLMF